MSTFVCEFGANVPRARNHDKKMIGVWCGNCNQKYTFKPLIEDGQHRLWCRHFKCFCDARRKDECSCDPQE